MLLWLGIDRSILRFQTAQGGIGCSKIAADDVLKNLVELDREHRVSGALPAKIQEPCGQTELISLAPKTRLQVFSAKILDNPQVPVTVFACGFDGGAFAEIIPRDNQGEGGAICKSAFQGLAQCVAIAVAQVTPVVAHACLLIDIGKAREGAADIGWPQAAIFLEPVFV